MNAQGTTPAGGKQVLNIGWGQADMTPARPVPLAGQFHVRISEGVRSPLSVTALALDSGQDHVVFVTLDLVGFSDVLVERIRQGAARLAGLDVDKLVMSVTHTHTAPETRGPAVNSTTSAGNVSAGGDGVDFKAKPVDASQDIGIAAAGAGVDFTQDVMSTQEIVAFVAERVVEAIRSAWEGRRPGKAAFGLGHAVVGRNRRWTATDGRGVMYGNTAAPEFSHIEGYEDPTVNVLATYDLNDELTGVVVNVACPSQETEHLYEVSADFWHETRLELRRRHGQKLYILPQCSSAGDQTSHPIWGKAAQQRMLELKGRTALEEIAVRLSDAVDDVLPAIKPTAAALAVRHMHRDLALPMNRLTQQDVDDAKASAALLHAEYETLKKAIEEDPSIRQKDARWYVPITRAFRRARWYENVAARFEAMKASATYPARIHAVRLGEMALTTQPFEYYLDFGLRIKARSKATQTFLLQLVGNGTYCPSRRSVAGGGYGSVPASNVVGPEAGEMICEESLKMIDELWTE